AKVIENTQRDLNISLMNELAIIFDKLNIDTSEVLVGAGTKWNFLNFSPGLVGGHCIGVDPYYLTHKAQTIGHHPEVIVAGRNTRVIDIVKELEDFGVEVQVTDAYADAEEASREYGIDLVPYEVLKPADAVVYTVPHDAYLDKDWEVFDDLLKHGKGIVVDVK